MKCFNGRSRWLVWCVLFAAITAGGAFAQAEPAAAAQQAPGKRPQFTLVTPCIDEPFFAEVTRGARDAAKLMDVDCEFWGTQSVDIEAQVAMVRKAIRDGSDGIAVAIIDATAFDAVLDQAKEHGIPVVAFNVNAQPHSRIPTVAQNLYDGGREAAFVAAPLIPDHSRVLLTVHHDKPTVMDQRYQGIRDGLKDKDIIWETVLTGGDTEEMRRTLTEKLQANPGIRAVFATGLADTEAAGQAVEKNLAGRECVIVGFDVSGEVLRLVKAGAVSFTVDQQPYLQGFYPIMQLALTRREGTVPTNIDTGSRIIRTRDVDAVQRQVQKPAKQLQAPAR